MAKKYSIVLLPTEMTIAEARAPEVHVSAEHLTEPKEARTNLTLIVE